MMTKPDEKTTKTRTTKYSQHKELSKFGEEQAKEFVKNLGEKTTPHKYTGEEVGLAFIWEFIRVYKGHSENTIPDEKRGAIVAALNNQDDITTYLRYRDIYAYFSNTTLWYERIIARVQLEYMLLKAAMADGDTMREDEIDSFFLPDASWNWFFSPTGEKPQNNHEKIETILNVCKRSLYVCRCIETGTKLIAQSLDIEESPFDGNGKVDWILKIINKLIRNHKELNLKPLKKRDIEPSRRQIEDMTEYSKRVKYNPSEFNFVFQDAVDI
jgi:hypothetical protein